LNATKTPRHEGKLDADFAGYAEIFRHGLTQIYFTAEDAESAEDGRLTTEDRKQNNLKVKIYGQSYLLNPPSVNFPPSLKLWWTKRRTSSKIQKCFLF
jgi:hypothetical protein